VFRVGEVKEGWGKGKPGKRKKTQLTTEKKQRLIAGLIGTANRKPDLIVFIFQDFLVS
jgi:hypothetical protein